tara:strand:- start:118 stop:246 length:129 start_codon:yes stop_codon:yes gene_type:complete
MLLDKELHYLDLQVKEVEERQHLSHKVDQQQQPTKQDKEQGA